MEKFNYSGKAEILHLNTRKEGPDEDKVLAADVKLRVVTSKEIMNFFEPLLTAVLFLDSGAVRNIMLDPITFSYELEHYRLETFGRSFVGCKVKKFELAPKDTNQITLTFQVSFKPSSDELAKLAEFLQDSIQVNIEPENYELDLGDAAQRMHETCKADGVRATLSTRDGKVLATYGGEAKKPKEKK